MTERSARKPEGLLQLVATPIGNMSDLTPRALEALRLADEVLAEDTRRTGAMMRSLSVPGRLTSFHDHNSEARLPLLTRWLSEGKRVALVSDSGTPGVSDPAYRAVRAALSVGARVEVLPGATAVSTALVGSGLPPDRFAFEGFLPQRAGRRRRRIEEMSAYPGTLVYFCGPHHLLRDLRELLEILGDRRACVARELTKLHEEYVRGRLSDLIEHFEGSGPRGEITLVVEGASSD
ncbi:16S rRNA (cytidine(1402)-2'-O)-methyltransferase [Candidatus Fermentibacterales bacterium]|nr:16S rRNA (cytidine(1402)-2'-O)-methyltransferase [Candidatus Fermentibacterales bacterium]